jgi:hypothetical protein
MGSLAWVWLFFACLIGTQVASVGNTLFLGYWSGNEINGFSEGQYMAIYAGMSGCGEGRRLTVYSFWRSDCPSNRMFRSYERLELG